MVYYHHQCILTTFKVSKESILREGASNFPVNFYADEINFDADGVAKLTCENTSENIVDVDPWPNEVATWNSYIRHIKYSYYIAMGWSKV